MLAKVMLRSRLVTCPSCHTRLRVSAAHPAGTQVRCGACTQLFRAPAASEVARAAVPGVRSGPVPSDPAVRPDPDGVRDTPL